MEMGGVMLSVKNQDACFMSGSWMGVADGVGGWVELSVDPGPFARELMQHSRTLSELHPLSPPKTVLIDALARCKELGSSTALLLRMNAADSTLHAANLGDSGFMVIRDQEVVAASRPMQADFRSPIQVGHHPDIKEPQFDDPGLAETYEVAVVPGDVVLVFTDGLSDFLFREKILRVVEKSLGREGGTLEDCAVKLALKARAKMSRSTPYFCAKRENVRADDITILVARLPSGQASRGDPKVAVLQNPAEVEEETSLMEAYARGGHINDPEEEGPETGTSHLELLSFGVRNVPVAENHSHDAWFKVDGPDHRCSWLGVATETCGGYPESLSRLCGKFSARLMDCSRLFLSDELKLKPKAVVVKAARKAKDKVGKTSTVLLAALDRHTGLLDAAWIGDSRLVVLREWKVIAATAPLRRRAENVVSSEQEFHPFDEPLVVTASGFPGDDPRSVVRTLAVRVKPGDVVVCGTRGVFESLYVETIVKVLRKEVEAGGGVDGGVRKLVEKAKAAMGGATPRINVLANNTLSRVKRVADITAIVVTI